MDIVAAAVCIDKLNIDRVVCPKIYEGQGFVRCQHGQIPIPVPAVVNIAIEHGLRLHTDKRGINYSNRSCYYCRYSNRR